MRSAARFLILFFLPSVCVVVSDTCLAQQNSLESILDHRVHNYQIKSDNLIQAFVKVASDFRIPMGVQWILEPSADRKLALSWEDTTVRNILSSIIETRPGYLFSTENGVLHIGTTIPKHQNFLFVPIGSFEVHHEAVRLAEQRLQIMARSKIAPPPNAAGGGRGGSVFGNVGEPTVDVALESADVEDVLDALALASDKKIWIVTFANSLDLMPTGFRRTLSLWNLAPIPDDKQPVWDIFRWAERVPLGRPDSTESNPK